MRHEWIFDVLEDLKTYAALNGLQDTAAKAEEALRAARAEVGLSMAGEPHRHTLADGTGR
ncbi:MAG: hypothetical protein K9G71_11025 [Rhodobacteraceae bacterium]|nr:hypothetical protein [Paracoccaceae bacterium]MCF8514887.1 hypothetical protein [Paracoccaceae bacterium]MCF8519131.1 hypothetical protein [Paracoccaceae bacterium]